MYFPHSNIHTHTPKSAHGIFPTFLDNIFDTRKNIFLCCNYVTLTSEHVLPHLVTSWCFHALH